MTVGQLTWLRFKRNRLAVIAGILLILFYLVAAFAGFFSPYDVRTIHSKFPGVPANGIRIRDQSGQFRWPFVYGYESYTDPETFRRMGRRTDEIYPMRFFAKGEPYTLLGFIEADLHLFTVDDPGKVFLLGTDDLGKDLFTRILYGAQVSLTVGLVGVALSLVIGCLVGMAAGYYGGVFDDIAMRIVEVLMAFPQIPLWMALASALPPGLDSVKTYFGITVVLSLVNWGGLARQMRAKVLAMRDTDFVLAARVANCSDLRIILRHLLPSALSHVIVVATLAIPSMILGETALSFLGLGIRPPMTSWGLLLSQAQETRVLLQKPWLLWAIVPVMITSLGFNLVGDAIRDAVDPFAV
ncbi:MAG: ABC transporter permease [Anaerolineae bacterium]|nr:ABC transporter permease [Anaerolineae bacterium]